MNAFLLTDEPGHRPIEIIAEDGRLLAVGYSTPVTGANDIHQFQRWYFPMSMTEMRSSAPPHHLVWWRVAESAAWKDVQSPEAFMDAVAVRVQDQSIHHVYCKANCKHIALPNGSTVPADEPPPPSPDEARGARGQSLRVFGQPDFGVSGLLTEVRELFGFNSTHFYNPRTSLEYYYLLADYLPPASGRPIGMEGLSATQTGALIEQGGIGGDRALVIVHCAYYQDAEIPDRGEM